jgi:SAM-dependent methyltransferase
MEDDIKLFYDLTAEKTADEWYANGILLPTIEEFISLLPQNPRVLDLGCGPGHETRRIACAGAEAIGIDYSGECIRVAKERCPECRFEVMDFRCLDGRFGEFDGVFASGSLIHIPAGELPDVIGRIAGVLKANGYFLAIIQDGEGVNEKWSRLEAGGRTLRRTVYCHRRHDLVSVAAGSGLEFVKEGCLDNNLYEQGWRNYIFRKDRL